MIVKPLFYDNNYIYTAILYNTPPAWILLYLIAIIYLQQPLPEFLCHSLMTKFIFIGAYETNLQ